MTLKVVTINILSDLSRWSIRRELLVNQLADLSPDIIAIQEVALPEDPTGWLAEQLSLRSNRSHRYEIFLCPKNGSWGKQEGIAILCNLPVQAHDSIPLGGQGRVAQKIKLKVKNELMYVANVHLYWQPGHSEIRLQQVDNLLQWMDGASRDSPAVICGDFNDLPDSEAIRLIRKNYKSAYNLFYNEEPDFTYPSTLPVSMKYKIKTILRYAPYLRLGSIMYNRRFTLDYIFLNSKFIVRDVQLVLNKPHPTRTKVYPSDHFGIYAELSSNL